MDDAIKVQGELFKRDGQWKLTLYAPDWVISDLMRTMETQTHPQILVYASASFKNRGWEYIHFTTWGGGAIGSAPPDGVQKLIQFVASQVATEEPREKS